MQKLNSSGWSQQLKQWSAAQRPLLGICLGLQLLFESSAEGQEQGLALLPGRVEPLPPQAQERCPHMGWAPLTAQHPSPLLAADEQPWMYFVHSFAASATDPDTVTVVCDNARLVTDAVPAPSSSPSSSSSEVEELS